ncbi:hypothetical protein E2320_013772 [Naja naja]|nr:hypothetical protein E2320_013772 [Naja naja]
MTEQSVDHGLQTAVPAFVHAQPKSNQWYYGLAGFVNAFWSLASLHFGRHEPFRLRDAPYECNQKTHCLSAMEPGPSLAGDWETAEEDEEKKEENSQYLNVHMRQSRTLRGSSHMSIPSKA